MYELWMRLRPSLRLMALAIVCGCAADSSVGSTEPTAPVVTTVSVTPSVSTLGEIGATAQLQATSLSSSGQPISGRSVTWMSSDPAVASVDANGLVTAVANGRAAISATVDGVEGSGRAIVTTARAFLSHRFRDDANGTNPVTVIKVAEHAVTSTLSVPHLAGEIAIAGEGTRAVIPTSSSQPGLLSVVDLESLEVTSGAELGFTPIYADAAPDGSRVYVGNVGSKSVSVVDMASGLVVASVDVGGLPRGIAVTPDGQRVYVSLGDDCPGRVAVIDATSDALETTIDTSACTGGDVAISPDGRTAYVPDGRGQNVTVIATATNSVAATMAGFASPRGVDFSVDGHFAYVTNYLTEGDLFVVSTASHAIVSTVDLGDCSPLDATASPEGEFVYVTCTNQAKVMVLSTLANTVLTSIPVAEAPYWIDFVSN